MEQFCGEIKKDESGRLTILELPFHARETFQVSKGTIFVKGTINDTEYRSKLLSRGNGRFVMVIDKAMQKAIGFQGEIMTARITMAYEDNNASQIEKKEPEDKACGMDVLTAIKTRQSIRRYTGEPVSEALLNTILSAGLYAPTAKNKRPYHFVVIRDRALLCELAHHNSNAAMLETAACGIAVCGDKNREGRKEFLYADCAAATQNMLLCIHASGLGGVWCGVLAHSEWQKLLIDRLGLPAKLEPVSVIAIGWPDGEKEPCHRWEPEKIHYDGW